MEKMNPNIWMKFAKSRHVESISLRSLKTNLAPILVLSPYPPATFIEPPARIVR